MSATLESEETDMISSFFEVSVGRRDKESDSNNKFISLFFYLLVFVVVLTFLVGLLWEAIEFSCRFSFI